MTAWNQGFVSPGLCSGLSFLLWCRAWIWYCSYAKSKLWLLVCFSRVIVLSMGPYLNVFAASKCHDKVVPVIKYHTNKA